MKTTKELLFNNGYIVQCKCSERHGWRDTNNLDSKIEAVDSIFELKKYEVLKLHGLKRNWRLIHRKTTKKNSVTEKVIVK